MISSGRCGTCWPRRRAPGSPLDLTITNPTGLGRTLTASVRGDTDALRWTPLGLYGFRWQVVLTAADPALYEDDWQEVTLAPGAGGATGRLYQRLPPWVYAGQGVPTQAMLENDGNWPAPVFMLYTGDFASGSQVTDDDQSGAVNLAALQPGEQVLVESDTLSAVAAGGLSRASYILAGSTPLVLPPLSQGQWHLYSVSPSGYRAGHPRVEVRVGVSAGAAPRAPIVPLPGQWTFWADLMVGGAPLGPVDVASFTATSKLSDFGSGTVTIVLPCGIDPARIVRLWSWRLWAFYAGTPVWCGVPTGITDHCQASVDLTLTELPGYLTKRLMDWSPSKVYAQIEQTTIASDIATPLLDLSRCTIQVVPGGGFKRDRTYEYLANTRATELTNLSQVISGPEFRPEYSVSGGIPACSFKIAYPRVGSGAAGLGVVVPGETLGLSAAVGLGSAPHADVRGGGHARHRACQHGQAGVGGGPPAERPAPAGRGGRLAGRGADHDAR